MNVTRTVIATTAAAVMVTGIGATALAQGRGGPWGRGGGGMRMEMAHGLRQLDLTAEQRELVRAVFDQHRAAQQALRERAAAARQALREAERAEPLNEGVIRSKAADVAAVEADAAVLRAQVHSEVFRLLTPEQQAKARSLREQREVRRQERQELRKQRLEQRRQAQPRPPQ
jgi:Spy/CpxP family protein refolding chaperone